MQYWESLDVSSYLVIQFLAYFEGSGRRRAAVFSTTATEQQTNVKENRFDESAWFYSVRSVKRSCLPMKKKTQNSEESEIAALIHVETVWAPLLRAMWGLNTVACRWFLTVYISWTKRKKTKHHFNLSLQKGARSFLSFLSTISAPTPHVNSALSASWKCELTGADKRCGGGCHGKGALWAALKAESCPTTRHHIDTLAIRLQKGTMTW